MLALLGDDSICKEVDYVFFPDHAIMRFFCETYFQCGEEGFAILLEKMFSGTLNHILFSVL